MAFSIKQVKKILSDYDLPAENLDRAAEELCSKHKADLDAIIEERDSLKKDAESLVDVADKLAKAEAKLAKNGDEEMIAKAEYDKLKKSFDDYKADITAKETKAAKEKAVRAYFESKNITGKNLELAMRGSGKEIEAVEIENGKIKDTAVLDALIAGDYSGLINTTMTRGADTANPPTSTGSSTMTREDIMKIKDTSERQKAWGEYIKTQKENVYARKI